MVVALLALPGCEPDRPDSLDTRADATVGGRPAPGSTPDPASRDAPVHTPSPAAPTAVDAEPVPPATATAAELEALGEGLGVPVLGVTRAALRDSYLEARGERVHHAIDIHAPRGTPVLSAADGRLLRLFDSRAGGLMVYAADRTGRFILYYGHLDAWAEGLVNGQALVRGQVIGYVGTTGNAPPDTPHLHFGILRGEPERSWSAGTAVNPYPLLMGGRTQGAGMPPAPLREPVARPVP